MGVKRIWMIALEKLRRLYVMLSVIGTLKMLVGQSTSGQGGPVGWTISSVVVCGWSSLREKLCLKERFGIRGP